MAGIGAGGAVLLPVLLLGESAGTAMPAFDFLTGDEIWRLVIYLRSLAADH